MAQLVVRNLEEDVKARLQRRASRHGRSMEQEVREILRNAAMSEDTSAVPLGSRIKERFAGIGLGEEITPLRGQRARPAAFDK
jgi:plasmid stability protein